MRSVMNGPLFFEEGGHPHGNHPHHTTARWQGPHGRQGDPFHHRLCKKSRKDRPRYGYQLTTTKESNDRYVDVAPEYMDFMQRYYDYWKTKKRLMGASWQTVIEKKNGKHYASLRALAGNDFVICNDQGWPLNPDGYAAMVRRVGDRAGVRHLHPHMFRHTFVSLLMSNPEIDVATVAAEAGHAQPSTTLMIYTQQYKKRQKRKADMHCYRHSR